MTGRNTLKSKVAFFRALDEEALATESDSDSASDSGNSPPRRPVAQGQLVSDPPNHSGQTPLVDHRGLAARLASTSHAASSRSPQEQTAAAGPGARGVRPFSSSSKKDPRAQQLAALQLQTYPRMAKEWDEYLAVCAEGRLRVSAFQTCRIRHAHVQKVL